MKGSSSVVAGSGGVGVGFVLTVLFAVLKLVHVVAWSWWLVLMPLMVSVGLLGLFAVAFVVVATWVFADELWQGD